MTGMQEGRVTETYELDIDSGGLPISPEITFTYEVSLPHVVQIRMDHESGPLECLVAREALESSLVRSVNESKVLARRKWFGWFGNTIILTLFPPPGAARFSMSTNEMRLFLEATYSIVPRGSESDSVDFDAELVRLRDLSAE